MNPRIVFIVLVLAAILYPPWSPPRLSIDGMTIPLPRKWEFLFDPPDGGSIDGVMLLVEIAGAAAISYGVAWARKKG